MDETFIALLGAGRQNNSRLKPVHSAKDVAGPCCRGVPTKQLTADLAFSAFHRKSQTKTSDSRFQLVMVTSFETLQQR